eukprot:8274121-Heterocapsa_arctica.AAC.1
MMQEKLEETIRTKSIMQEIADTLRGTARADVAKPVDTDKEKEKEDKRLRDPKQACDDQDRFDKDKQRETTLTAEE